MNEEYTFISKIIGVLRKPDITFNHINEDDLLQASIIILISMVLSSWAGIVYRLKIPTSLIFQGPIFVQMNPDMLRQNMIILSVVRGILSILLSWVIPTAIIHLISKTISGTGSLRRFFVMMGFSFSPMLIQNLLRLIDSYTISPLQAGFLLTVNPEIGIAGIILPLLKVYTIFRIASISINSYAISTNYQIDRTKALIIGFSSYLVFLIPSLL